MAKYAPRTPRRNTMNPRAAARAIGAMMTAGKATQAYWNGRQSSGSFSTPLQDMKSGTLPGPAAWSFRYIPIA